MAHFVYPAGTPLGTVPSFYVVPSTEWQLVIQQLYAAINGDDGGTWAPGAFITVGGSGFQLTGTGHSLASGARLTVQSTGEVRLSNGALLKADGTGGDIRLEVLTNVATLTAETGTVIKVNAGGALDVYGSATFKDTSGPGSATWESSTTATWLSGSTLILASGATAALTGSTLVRGTLTIKASGGPGALVQESGTTATFAGSVGISSTASITYSTGSTVNGRITRQGPEERSGSTARTIYRPYVTLPGNADADLTVAEDAYRVPQSITANRTYTLRHTGTVPNAGERIRVHRMGTTTPTSLSTAKIVREDATIVFSFYGSKQGFAEFEFDGSDWQLVAGAQYASSTDSGYYDDVW